MKVYNLFSREYFPRFHNKDEFFNQLLEESELAGKILSLFLILIIFSFLYGIVMGSYHSFIQSLAAGIKLPVLFTLTVIICFPAFYIIQYIMGSKLRLSQMIIIMLSGMVLTTAIMISFTPIVIFFLLTGSNYYFLQLLHICIFILSGVFGMKVIIDALKYSCEKMGIYPRVGVEIFRFWVVIMAFVGIQLAWNLRPFLGDTGKPFKLFRDYQGNFYTALIYSFEQLSHSGKEKEHGKIKSRQVPQTLPFDSLKTGF
jgi:hypothetical protein